MGILCSQEHWDGNICKGGAKQRSGPEGLESGPWKRDPVAAPCQRVAGWKCPGEGGAAGPKELRPGGLAPCASVTWGLSGFEGFVLSVWCFSSAQFSFPLPHVRHPNVLRSTKKRPIAPPPIISPSPSPPQAALPDCLVALAALPALGLGEHLPVRLQSSAMVVGADVLLPGPQGEACGVCR